MDDIDRSDYDSTFADAVARPEEDLDLAAASLLIAVSEYHDLDIRRYLRRLDTLGQQYLDRFPDDATAQERITALNTFLFDELGFRGNYRRYYDPQNSFLNRVLERRTGIPISLSVVYMEIARRGGLAVEGVGLPGHFLVRCRDVASSQEPMYIDAFNHGTMLNEADCAALVARARQSTSGSLLREYLQPVPKRRILGRMLRNLRGIFLRQNDLPRALGMVDKLVTLEPDDREHYRDRGTILFQLQAYTQAQMDLEHYCALAISGTGVEQAQGYLDRLARLRAN